MSSLKERLRETLVKNKLITEDELNKALEHQRHHGGRLSSILVELGSISEKELVGALSLELGLPSLDLTRIKIDKQLLTLIPKQTIERYHIFPLSKIGEVLTIAMVDPLDIFALDDLKVITGYRINPVIVSSQQFRQAIQDYFPESPTQLLEELTKGEAEEVSLELIKEEKERFEVGELRRMSSEAPVIRITNTILERAVEASASDILIEPLENSMRIRLRIDGILHEIESSPKSLHAPFVSRLKVISNLDIAEHRLPQDGRFKMQMGEREIDFRLSILPSTFGERAALRILDRSKGLLDIEKLGFGRRSLETLKNSCLKPHGMILVCGPTGCGKTTTLYSILKLIKSPKTNIITVEDPVEYQIAGINQVSINPEVGLTFASSLRSILRQDPDVIMVGEIRDYDTVDIAIKAALTGHLVLSTLHTTTACGSIVRLVDMGIEPFLIASSVIAIVAQRLVRRICSSCKDEYELKNELLGQLKVPQTKFFRGKGCKSCAQTGYSGRLGIAEVLALSPKVKDILLSKSWKEYKIKEIAIKEGMKTLRQEGMEKALSGLTSLEEIVQATPCD